MATQVQLRRGTSAQNDAFTGATGELTYDTTNKRVRVHDGGTAGGFEIKTEDGSGNTIFADNEKAIFGAGSDLQIYHDGSNSYIDEQGQGSLFIRGANTVDLITPDGTAYMARFQATGYNKLYHNGDERLETTNTGIDVTGTAVTDGLTVAGNLSVDGGTIKLDGNYPTGTDNVALGNAVLNGSLTGGYNTAMGATAMTALTSGSLNVGIGRVALGSLTSGSYNTGVGANALNANTTASNNTAVGFESLQNNTTGTINTALGRQALKANTTGADNTAVSYSMVSNTTGSNNTAVGRGALNLNTTGTTNTALGFNALVNNTTAADNTALGGSTLQANTTGANNTAVGRQALQSNTTASNNTAVGYQALTANTTGDRMVALGYQAGDANTTASYSTFVGAEAGSNSNANSNTFIGQSSGLEVTSGANNTIIGRYNGNQGSLDIRTSSNNIVLSDGDGNPRIVVDPNGKVGIGVTNPDAKLMVRTTANTTQPLAIDDSNNTATNTHRIAFRTGNTEVGKILSSNSSTSYNTTSDYRLKENVEDMTGAIDRVKLLSPKRFNFIVDETNTLVDGFLAHEAQTVVSEAVTGTHNEVDDDGNAVMQGIDQSKLVPLLTGALKEAIAKIEDLETRIATLEGA